MCSRAHVLQLLSLRAATTEAHAPRAHAPQQEKSQEKLGLLFVVVHGVLIAVASLVVEHGL